MEHYTQSVVHIWHSTYVVSWKTNLNTQHRRVDIKPQNVQIYNQGLLKLSMIGFFATIFMNSGKTSQNLLIHILNFLNCEVLVQTIRLRNIIFVIFKPLQIQFQFIHGSQISWYQKLEYLKETSALPNVFNEHFITERSMYGVHLTKDEIQTHKLQR